MALLLYSKKCSICRDVMSWLDSHKRVAQIVRFHDVNLKGIPPQYRNKIKAVPTLLTQNGKFLVGSEVKAWLISMNPEDTISNYCFGGKCNVYGIDDDGDDGDIFSLENHGQSIQPAITQELRERIDGQVMENYQKIQTALKE